ncbi:MAG: aminodeoxychorismate synthase component I [Cytophagaceae bacterium]
MKFSCSNIKEFVYNAILWADSYQTFSFFTDNNYQFYPFGGFKNMICIGEKSYFSFHDHVFASLKNNYEHILAGRFCGYFSYDLKNEVEKLISSNRDHLNFPLSYFFSPEHIIYIGKNEVEIISDNPEKIFSLITDSKSQNQSSFSRINIQSNTSKEEYLENVASIKNHLVEGDIYELNYCINFSGIGETDPVKLFFNLTEESPMPFSVLFKSENKYIISASPERFIKKEGNRLISQPIKGTAPRSADPQEDLRLKTELRNSPKEISENMMIVDLVRNDLARSSVAGTVKVEEAFGIYTFKKVHQMISTVCSQIRPEVHPIDAIKNAFPMGSMTGAPKIKAMELIEKYENFKRGMYSGAVGYFNQNGDFDFNVVIRSILYNDETKTISFSVGSAITYESDPEKEYQECLIKAESMMKILSQE